MENGGGEGRVWMALWRNNFFQLEKEAGGGIEERKGWAKITAKKSSRAGRVGRSREILRRFEEIDGTVREVGIGTGLKVEV